MMNEMGWEDDDLEFEDDDDNNTESHVEPTSGVHLGQGLLMGRLSRFIDAVTQPEDDDEDDEEEDEPQQRQQHQHPGSSLLNYLAPALTQQDDEGWDDDDGLDDLVDEDGWEEEDVVIEEDEEEAPQHQEETHVAQPVVENEPQVASGWDEDDLDEDIESLHEESQILTEQQMTEGGWGDNDDALEGLDDSFREEQPESGHQAEQQQGWEDDALEGLVDEGQAQTNGWGDDDALEGLGDSSPVQQPVQESEPQPSGWEDDDALEGLDDGGPAEQAGVEATGGWADDSLEGLDQDVKEAPPPPPLANERTDEVGVGWADDNLDELGDNDDAFQQDLDMTSPGARLEDTKVVVDHVPVPPSPRRTESMMTTADESTVLRENARDVEEDDRSDDYGPMVDHLPSVHRTEHSARTVSTVAPSFVEEENKADEQAPDPFAVVDHVPENIPDVSSPNEMGSETASAVEGDAGSSTQREDVRDDEVTEGDFGPVVDRMPSAHQGAHSGNRTVSTIVPSSEVSEELDEESKFDKKKTETEDRNAVVDHVPTDIEDAVESGTESSASVDGDATTEVQDDEVVEGDFGPVVDRMPSLRQSSQSVPTVSSLAPPSVEEELREDDAQEGSDEAISTEIDVQISVQRSVPAVDHVPEDQSKSNRDSVLAVASQMSVASELSNTIGDEALESDIEPAEENYGPVVDHTPVQAPLLPRRSTSVQVQAPIEEMDDEDEDDEEQYGLVVDHTPTPQPLAVSSVAGSMAVVASPSEVADDSSEDSDVPTETIYEEEGEGYEPCDDDTFDAPTSSLVSGPRDGPQLVDHVPPRPEARPTDASTLVVVDPSEVSTVGDMTYEEQQYGPVVDHTPPARPAVQASATGSTVQSVGAAATSVDQDDTVAGDLDDVADRDRAPDEHEGDSEDDATLPTLDTGVQPPMETNVVDHVPEAPPVYRIDSELTTAPTQSVLSPDETRDSDFGLVVDHLPAGAPPGPPSRGSMAVLAPSVLDEETESATVEEEVDTTGQQPASERTTEEAKFVVDHLPSVRETNSVYADSTVTVRSQMSEDETLEGVVRPDRFGPVVDQLPTAGLPHQMSLGGSTTGALATLSEVNDDTILDEETPGWDYDDQELDSIQESENDVAENGRQSRGGAGKGLSVTFSSHEIVKTVGGDEEVVEETELLAAISSPNGTQYFDAELGATPNRSVDLDETQYFDPESGEIVALDDEAGVSSEDRPEEKPAASHDRASQRAARSNGGTVHCDACSEAKTAACPCIESILQANSDENAMVISVMTPEGTPVTIDVRKLLQHETTKRMLLEKEVETCHSTIESLEVIVSQRDAMITKDEAAVNDLEESAKLANEERESLRNNCEALATDNEELNSQLTTTRDELFDLRRARDEWTERESALRSEIDDLRRTHEAATSEVQLVRLANDELTSEVERMRMATEELSAELARCKDEHESLKVKNDELHEESTSMQTALSDLDRERSDWSSRKSALEDEIGQLRRALEESSSAVKSETELREQLSSLQIEAAAKSGECEQLKAQMEQIQKKLQESEGRNFAQMKESTRVQRLHEGEVKKYRDQIESLEKSKKESAAAQDASAKEFNDRLSVMEAERNALQSDNESLRQAINDTRHEYEGQLRQQKVSLQEKLVQLRSLGAKANVLETEKARLSKDVSAMSAQLQEASTKADEAAAFKEEYDSLQETLLVNKETIQSLQEQVESLSRANKVGADQMETIVESLSQERDSLRNALQSNEEKVAELTLSLNASSEEKSTLQDRLETVAAKCGEMEARIEDLQSDAVKKELALAESERVRESLQTQVDNSAMVLINAREEYERELRTLQQRMSDEREESMRELQSRLDAQEQAIAERDIVISDLEQEKVETQQRVDTNRHEREDALATCRELEAQLTHAKEQQTRLAKAIQQHETKQLELQESLDGVVNERDSLANDRQVLEEENEELLVQLGLIKEQMDAHDGDVEDLQRALAEKDIATKHAEERLRDADAYIGELTRRAEEIQNRPEENGVHQSGNVSALETSIDELTLEKEDLQQQVDDLSSANAFIDAQVTSLKDEKEALLGRLRVLEERETDVGRKEDQRTPDLEERCRLLDERCKSKEEELEQVKARLHEATSSQTDIDSLQHHIVQLESACADRDRAMQERDMSLEQMGLEIESLRATTASSGRPRDEHDSDLLSRKLQHAEHSAQHYQGRVREMESALEQTRRELTATNEKLSETEAALFDKELELDVDEQNRGAQEDLHGQLREMEALLEQRDQEFSELVAHRRALEERMESMQAELDRRPETSWVSSNGPPSSVQPMAQSDETSAMRAELTALQEQLQASTAEHREKEDSIQQEVDALSDALSRKQARIDSLEQELQSLSVELHCHQEKLVSKEAEYRQLSMELEESRASNLESTRNVTSHVLDSTSNREEAESVETMRSHIISLARALERSETQRADANERLLKEREASTESLRRLGESVKRFYSTLSCGDA